MSNHRDKIPLSIFIICKNEAHVIAETLEQAAKLADEIIIVDSGSTDATLEIAKNYTNKIYFQDWLGYAQQKNFALSLCTHKWVLSLDADEVLSEKLLEEICLLFKENRHKEFLGFKIPRKLYIGERLVKWGGFYPDYQLRLFEKAIGRFQDLPVHESVELWSEKSQSFINKNSIQSLIHYILAPVKKKKPKIISSLSYPIEHYSYASIEELETAFMRYAHLSNKQCHSIIRFIKAAYAFINKYFLRLGFLDGILGFRLAIIYMKYTFIKYNRAL